MQYYYTDPSRQPKGPVTLEQLQALAASGAIDSSCLVVPVGGQAWLPIETAAPTAFQAVRSSTEPLAIWSFVLSLFGLLCGCLPGIAAIICGHIAMSNISHNPRLEGKGLAITGLIIGYCGIVFGGIVSVLLMMLRLAAEHAK